MADKDVGLYDKYRVQKQVPCDVPGFSEACPGHWERVEDRVFVLNPRTDPFARSALSHYATQAREAGYEKLAGDIFRWLESLD